MPKTRGGTPSRVILSGHHACAHVRLFAKESGGGAGCERPAFVEGRGAVYVIKPKTRGGNFFEDFTVGHVFQHAVPRTVTEGDLALYIALTGDRRPLHCSREFARSLGFEREVVHDLLVFHIVFRRALPDVS